MLAHLKRIVNWAIHHHEETCLLLDLGNQLHCLQWFWTLWILCVVWEIIWFLLLGYWFLLVWNRVWHSYGFWHERLSEYIRFKKMTRTNIRIYSYENFWHEQISEYICIKKITWLNIRIYSYNKFDTNECPNKYSSWKLYKYSNMFKYLNSFYTQTV